MRLILLRHAKSDWEDGSLPDRDRPLSARGRKAAPRIGAWIAARAQPDRILVSTAARTRETWEQLGLPGTPELQEALYLASAAEIFALLQPPPPGPPGPRDGTVLVIGHNPGIGEAAYRLARIPPEDADFLLYPTAACTILDFDGPPAWGLGTVTGFTIPRRL